MLTIQRLLDLFNVSRHITSQHRNQILNHLFRDQANYQVSIAINTNSAIVPKKSPNSSSSASFKSSYSLSIKSLPDFVSCTNSSNSFHMINNTKSRSLSRSLSSLSKRLNFSKKIRNYLTNRSSSETTRQSTGNNLVDKAKGSKDLYPIEDTDTSKENDKENKEIPIKSPPKDPDEDKSIHTGNNEEIHDVPISVIKRPIPPELEEIKVNSLMESMKSNDQDVPPIDVLWIKGEQEKSTVTSSVIAEVENQSHLARLLVESRDRLVILYFYASWCGPCKAISPEILNLSHTMPDVLFLKVNVDENDEIAIDYDINTMPTFVFVKNKISVGSFTGARIEKIRELVINHKN